jgi:hypothetical protein
MWKLIILLVAISSTVNGFDWNPFGSSDTKPLKNHFKEYKKTYKGNSTCLENKIDLTKYGDTEVTSVSAKLWINSADAICTGSKTISDLSDFKEKCLKEGLDPKKSLECLKNEASKMSWGQIVLIGVGVLVILLILTVLVKCIFCK